MSVLSYPFHNHEMPGETMKPLPEARPTVERDLVRPLDLVPLGRRVAGRRVEKGWTQARLAAEAGLSQHTIAVVEKGRHPSITLATIVAIADALEVGLDTLVHGR